MINPVVGFVASAVLIGGALAFGTDGGQRSHETPAPTTSATPAAKKLPKGYVARSVKHCSNPGNLRGLCWYDGTRWAGSRICLESNIVGAPLAAVARMYSTAGYRVTWRGSLGRCAAAGYSTSATLRFTPYTATDRRDAGDACAYTQASNYGSQARVYVRVALTGRQRTACGAGSEWTEVFAHETGHAFGLSHAQPYASSIMRGGHTVSAQDRAELAYIRTHR